MATRFASSASGRFLEVFQRFLARLKRQTPEPPPLRGRPAIRREKAYAADSGYVYQYTYEGYRVASRDEAAGREFVFDCTSDRASRFRISIFAPADSFVDWEEQAGRALSDVERYAVVKMRLFEIFDEAAHITSHLAESLTAEQVGRHVEALDL